MNIDADAKTFGSVDDFTTWTGDWPEAVHTKRGALRLVNGAASPAEVESAAKHGWRLVRPMAMPQGFVTQGARSDEAPACIFSRT